MKEQWTDSIAFVTGGASGIGRALCLALARRRVRVIVADLQVEAAQRVAAECGADARACTLDVRDASAVKAAIEETAARHGKLDYLFNNAGIAVTGEVEEMPLSYWDACIDVNVRGVVHGVMAAYPIMLKQGSGHIVNTASVAGLVAAPLLTPYCMSKHAIVGLSASLRVEGAARGVRVSALCPGVVETPMVDGDTPLLPKPVWRPDVRGYLTKITGPAYPADAAAEDALRGVEKNLAQIVIPGRVRFLWRLARLMPALAERGALDALTQERARRVALT